ncbi:MAG: serine/threonine protein kinase, partial [Myxococcales bacterium]|nr:serine/threonine protein kinase [Myxococcales bacterium]
MSTLTLLHSHEAVRELESRLLRALTLARLRGERPRSSDERFEIEGMLGRGASGIVCKATDHKLGRQIALKLFPGVRDSQLAGSVRNEARALGGLNHPNVVTVFDFDALAITPGSIHCFFVAMELLDGVSLRHWLARGQSKRAIVRMFCQAGDGLAAAHEQSLIHRDFKPENVMIHKGAPKIVDFGLAHAEIAAGLTSDPGLETRQRPLAGTLAYMAPEALRGRTDAKSDQFSFAAALWEALLGDLPYPIHSTAPEERQQIRAPADARAIPGEVVAVLLRALDAEPSRRFPTIAELVACLQALPEIPDAPPESLFAATSALELTADPLGIGVGADASALPPQDLQASFGAASIVDRSILGKRPRRRRRLLAASFFFGAAAVGSGYVAVSELGLPVDPRQLFERAPPLTVAAPPMVEPPPPAPPCADEREVVGDWRFATYATWATQSRWQGLSG